MNEINKIDYWNHWKLNSIKEFLESAQKNGITLFAGAGISVPYPSSCPTWPTFIKTIFELLIERLKNYSEDLKNLSNKFDLSHDLLIRPEVFMEKLTFILDKKLAVKFIGSFCSSKPNIIHKDIAAFSKLGFIKNIITTNFDTYIEQSLAENNVDYCSLRDNIEIESYKEDKNLAIFKPHGCISKPESLIFLIQEIQRLPQLKIDLFKSLIKDTSILIMGYSGFDEDIFPLLKSIITKKSINAVLSIYPGSNPYEPIQEWQTFENAKIKKTVGTINDLFNLFKRYLNVQFPKDFDSQDDLVSWKEQLKNVISTIDYHQVATSISFIYMTNGDFHRAVEFAKISENILSEIKDDSISKYKWILDGIYAQASKSFGDSKIALKIDTERLNWVLETKSAEFLIETALSLIHSAITNRDLKSAKYYLDIFEETIKLSDHYGSKLPNSCIMTFLQYKGNYKRHISEHEEAIKYLNEALEISEREFQSIAKGRICNDLGNIYLEVGDFKNAEIMWESSVLQAVEVTDWDTAGKASKNRGMLLSQSDDLMIYKTELLNSIKYFEKAGNYEKVKEIKSLLDLPREDLFDKFFIKPK